MPCLVLLQARKDAAQFAATQLETLSDKTKTPTSQLKFIMDAWAQVGRWHIMTGHHDCRGMYLLIMWYRPCACYKGGVGTESASNLVSSVAGGWVCQCYLLLGALHGCRQMRNGRSDAVAHCLSSLPWLGWLPAAAAVQVIECRRILKWTYAYGYYKFEDEEEPGVRHDMAGCDNGLDMLCS